MVPPHDLSLFNEKQTEIARLHRNPRICRSIYNQIQRNKRMGESSPVEAFAVVYHL